MFKIIRLGTGFDPVIVVSPPMSSPGTDAKFYRLASWQIGTEKAGEFHEITQDCALGYFSGIADGIGYEIPPDKSFESLESVLTFITKERDAWLLKKYPMKEKN